MSSRTVRYRQKCPEESGLIWGALICFAAAMIAGGWDILSLFRPESREAVIRALLEQQIRGEAALQTWYLFHSCITVYTVLCGWILGAVLLLTVVLRRQDRAMELLSWAAQGLRMLLKAVRILLIAVFVFKFVRYTLRCIGINGGSMLFFSMALFEGFLFTLVMLGFAWLIRFLDGAADSVCAVRYTLLSGDPDPRGIHPGIVPGLWALTAVHLVLAYLYRWNPGMTVLEWSMAAGYLLLGIWLRQYRSAMEWQLLENRIE